jgi:hypothetical protein
VALFQKGLLIMKPTGSVLRPFLRPLLAAALVLFAAADARAVRRTEDPLALVPADAASVAYMRWSELRQTPLGGKVFRDLDHISGDDDAARFLEETGLTPREDIDTVIVAMTPAAKGAGDSGLVIFEGRFDLARIGKALASREATLRTSPGGEYYLLRENGDEPGAVALVNRGLIVCGNEESVVATLARRESGGEGGLTSGQGLGRHLSRIDRDASAWALVDVARFPATRRTDPGEGEPSRALFSAMKSVSIVALEASVKSDGVAFAATGLSADAESRDLLEDALRGVLAMWRLAVQDRAPELVSVIRRFKIENDSDGVSIRGTLPSGFLESLSEKRRASR